MLPCAQIAREIERDLNFLTTRLRDVPDRHRSIQAVFEHSWRLLSPSEQAIFQQLSIFRGGFHRNAAEQVAGASWLDLATLVEKSLLSVDATGRYSIHELLRQYGAGKLGMDPAEKQATVARHGRYFAGFLDERLQVINGEEQRQAATEIATELDNVRAAWQWAVQQRRLDDISRSISTYYSFCQLQSRFLEGVQALQAAQGCLETLEATHQRDLTLAHVLNHQGWLYIRLGQFDHATAALQRSCDLYAQLNVPPQTIMGGDSTVALAMVYLIQGTYRRSVELSEKARRVAEGHSDQHNLAFAHYVLTAAQLALGDYVAAQSHAHQARRAARASGMSWFLAYVLNESGKVARAMGNLAEAEHYFRDSYAIKEEFGDPEGMAVALNHLGETACLQEDYGKAEQLYHAAIRLYQGISDRGGLATAAKGLGEIACVRRDYATAKQHFAHALTIATEIRFWPLAFSILLSVSRLLMQTGAQSLAIEVLRLVQQQPASDHETKERATQQLLAWQDATPADLFADAVNRGTIRTAETVISLVSAEFEAL